jgi:putative membrane protein
VAVRHVGGERGRLVFWGLVIAGIVVLVRYVVRTERQAGWPGMDRPTAEQVLTERFARGDLDEEEYHRRLHTLRVNGGAASRP